MLLSEILNEAKKRGASDVHFTVGLPPMFRVLGEIVSSEMEVLNRLLIEKYIHDLKKMEVHIIVDSMEDTDFSFSDFEGYRYRVNVYNQQNNPCMAIRLLSMDIPTVEEIGFPEVIRSFANLNRGLILVTGPTGSGKTTTLAAMIDYINKNRKLHVITIEDPIEYVYKHNKSIIHQREVGHDVTSFEKALRSALREDPDVILVGEMRDFETIQAAITAAETGHLVISTLHTNSAVATIDRIIDVFPENQQQQIRIQLAATLKGVISQQLVKKANGKGRRGAWEILVVNEAVSALIREKKTHQIDNVIQTNARLGMQLMDTHLVELVKNGEIQLEEAMEKSYAPDIVSKIYR